jgi:hypothetical protein
MNGTKVGRYQITAQAVAGSGFGTMLLLDTETGRSWNWTGKEWIPIPFKGDAPTAPPK